VFILVIASKLSGLVSIQNDTNSDTQSEQRQVVLGYGKEWGGSGLS
jgi:hypothetical protein